MRSLALFLTHHSRPRPRPLNGNPELEWPFGRRRPAAATARRPAPRRVGAPPEPRPARPRVSAATRPASGCP